MTRIVSTYELRDNLADYLDKVLATDTPLVVSRFNKPMVIISPYKEGELTKPEDYFGFLGSDTDGEKFLKKVRRSAKEKNYVKNLRSGNG